MNDEELIWVAWWKRTLSPSVLLANIKHWWYKETLSMKNTKCIVFAFLVSKCCYKCPAWCSNFWRRSEGMTRAVKLTSPTSSCRQTYKLHENGVLCLEALQLGTRSINTMEAALSFLGLIHTILPGTGQAHDKRGTIRFNIL